MTIPPPPHLQSCVALGTKLFDLSAPEFPQLEARNAAALGRAFTNVSHGCGSTAPGITGICLRSGSIPQSPGGSWSAQRGCAEDAPLALESGERRARAAERRMEAGGARSPGNPQSPPSKITQRHCTWFSVELSRRGQLSEDGGEGSREKSKAENSGEGRTRRQKEARGREPRGGRKRGVRPQASGGAACFLPPEGRTQGGLTQVHLPPHARRRGSFHAPGAAAALMCTS